MQLKLTIIDDNPDCPFILTKLISRSRFLSGSNYRLNLLRYTANEKEPELVLYNITIKTTKRSALQHTVCSCLYCKFYSSHVSLSVKIKHCNAHWWCNLLVYRWLLLVGRGGSIVEMKDRWRDLLEQTYRLFSDPILEWQYASYCIITLFCYNHHVFVKSTVLLMA